MTICIAAICRFNYATEGEPDWGASVLVAADRMFTDTGLEIQYESGQGKWATLGRRVLVLVADSMPVQSEILLQLRGAVGDNMDVGAREVAGLYADLVLKYKREEAERLYLSPYGMTMEGFAREIKSTSPGGLITDLANSVLDHSVDVEAIVSGVTADGNASIYHVNGRGQITSHADVGFLSIGSGHYHSNAFLTSHGYWNRWRYYETLSAVYAAKRQAENAPGVGRQTDMLHITRDGWFPVEHHLREALDAEYPRYTKELAKLETRLVERVWARADKTRERARAKSDKVVTLKTK